MINIWDSSSQQTESDCNKYFKLYNLAFMRFENILTLFIYTLFSTPLGSVQIEASIKETQKNVQFIAFYMSKWIKFVLRIYFIFFIFNPRLHILTVISCLLFPCRKCICNSSNTVREKSSKCSKLFNLIIGGSGSPCCLPRHASVGCLWNFKRVEVRSWVVRHVDEQWCSLLHSLNSSPRRYCAWSVR